MGRSKRKEDGKDLLNLPYSLRICEGDEKQIFEFLSKYPPRNPWFERVQKVKVREV